VRTGRKGNYRERLGQLDMGTIRALRRSRGRRARIDSTKGEKDQKRNFLGEKDPSRRVPEGGELAKKKKAKATKGRTVQHIHDIREKMLFAMLWNIKTFNSSVKWTWYKRCSTLVIREKVVM